MAQFLRPTSTITATNFTGGFADIDESTASDADYAYSANNTTATLVVGLSSASAPGSGNRTIRYRIARTNGATLDGTGSNSTVSATLLQGSTVIATDTTRDTTGSWVQYDWVVDTSSVTDWTTLRLEFDVVGGGGSPANRRGAGISWAEMEIPDAPIFGTGTGSSTSSGTASSTLAATGNQTGSSAGITSASGTQVASALFSGTSTSVATLSATGLYMAYLVGVSTGTSSATGPSEYTPGEILSTIDSTGWVPIPTGASVLTAVNEIFTDDTDYIVSSELSTQREITYEIEPVEMGAVDVTIRAATTKTNGQLTVALLNNSTVIHTFTPVTVTQTLTDYLFSDNIPQSANRIRIQIVEV